MKRTTIGIALIVLGVLIVAAGFIPLMRREIVTEEKTKKVTEYREETKTREETYTEEQIIGFETKDEILFKESVPVTRGSTLGKTFELTEGDIIKIKACADSDMMLSFTGQGEIYMSLEIGTDIEKEFTIKKSGEHNLLYSSALVIQDVVIDFDIVRVYNEPITEEVEKTRTVEYTEKIPYTVDVPYTEKTAKEVEYTLDYPKYLGAGVVVAGLAVYVWGFRKQKPKEKSKKARNRKKKK